MKIGEITLLQVENIGKIKFASLKLDPNGKLVKITGPNESGKSTLIDSLKLAFDSAKSMPQDIIKHGQERGTVKIETSGGYSINRMIIKNESGVQETSLEVRFNGAPVKGGAVTFLKELSAAYKDPQELLDFSNEAMLKMLSTWIGLDLDSLDKQIISAQDEVTVTRRSINALGDKVPPPEYEGGEPLDLQTVTNEYEASSKIYNEAVARHTQAAARMTQVNTIITESTAHITELEEKLTAEKARLSMAMQSKQDGLAWYEKNPAPDRAGLDDIKAKMDRAIAAQQNTESHRAYQMWWEQKQALEKDLEARKKALEDTKARRQQAMSSITLPAEDVKIVDGQVMIGDSLWQNGSTSAKLVAAAKFCAASIPKGGARFLYIHRGESIGTERQEILAKFARDNDLQIFMEIMSDKPGDVPDAVMIQEGAICVDNLIQDAPKPLALPEQDVAPWVAPAPKVIEAKPTQQAAADSAFDIF